MLERKIIFSNDIALAREKAKQKYIDLLNLKISPDKILFLSINAHRFESELKNEILEKTNFGFEEIYIDNFSSFSKKIIRKFYYLLDLPKDFEVISGFEQKLILKKILTEEDFFRYDSFKNLDEENRKIFNKVKITDIFINSLIDLLDNFKSNIDIYKKENLISNFYHDKFCSSKLKLNFYNFYDIYKVYQNFLKQYNFLDYKDLIVKTIELFLHNPIVLDYFKEVFSNVILEEAEEITKLEAYLLEILCSKKDINLFFTYTDKCIFTYKGTSINFIKNLIKKLDLVEEKIENKLENPKFFLNHFSTEEDEINYVAEKIIDLVSNKNYELKDIIIIRKSLKDVAILFREIFNKYNIPFLLDGMGGVFDDKIILDLILYLKIIYLFNDETKNFLNFDNFFENFINILFLNYSNDDILDLKNILLEKKTFFLSENNLSKKNFLIFLKELEISYEKDLQKSINNFLDVLDFYKKNENVNIKEILFFICQKYNISDFNSKKWEIIVAFFKSIDDFEKIFSKIYFNSILDIEKFIYFLDEFLKTYTFELGLGNNKENLLLISTISNSKFFMKNKKIVFFLGNSDEILISDDEKFNIFFQKDEIVNMFKKMNLNINFSAYYKEQSFDNDLVLFEIGKNLASEETFFSYFDFLNLDNKNKLNKSIFLDNFQNSINLIENDCIRNFLVLDDKNIKIFKLNKNPENLKIEEIFLKKIKSKKYFSYSNVKNYLDCNRKFLIENLFFIKDIKPDKNIFIGNLVHKILKDLHSRFNHSSDFATMPCKKYLKDLININFNINNNSMRVYFDCISEALWYKQKIEKILLDYLEDLVFYGERKILFLEKELTSNFDKFLIKGRIDRIDDLGVDIFEIIDYKTSLPRNLKTETMKKSIVELKELQFLFYYLILKNKKDFIKFKDLKFSFVWLIKEKPARPKNNSYKKFGIDSIFYEEFLVAEKNLLKIFNDIIDDDFKTYNTSLEICERCGHKFICLN